MKTLLLTMLVSCLSMVSIRAGTGTESETVYATRGEPFEMTGFVLGHNGGNCVPGTFTYLLDSTDHRNKFWLCATGSNEQALHKAMLTRGIYNITGTLQLGADRPYVEVDTVSWY